MKLNKTVKTEVIIENLRYWQGKLEHSQELGDYDTQRIAKIVIDETGWILGHAIPKCTDVQYKERLDELKSFVYKEA